MIRRTHSKLWATVGVSLAVVMTMWVNVSAQDFATVSGTVRDAVMHQPIAGVVVTVLPAGYSAVTDAEGRYQIGRVMPGNVSLVFESAFHVRHQSAAMIMREGEESAYDVVLQPRTVRATSQTVTGEKEREPNVEVFDHEVIQQSASTDVGGFLQERGYQIQSDGRAEYLSLGGLSPQRTLVLIDGVKLNPNGGAADLSQVLLASIERVEIISAGAAARYGEGALGGAVNIVSRRVRQDDDDRVTLSSSGGSYSSMREALMLDHRISQSLQVSANGAYEYARNDFSYQHPYSGEQRRANNASRQSQVFATVGHERIEPLTLSVRYFRGHHGSPGAVLQETPTASALHSNLQLTANYKTSVMNATTSYREMTQHFEDQSSATPYDRYYLQVARQGDLEREWVFGSNVDLTLGGQYLSESFFGDDRQRPQASLPAVSRTTSAAFADAKVDQRLGLLNSSYALALRVDHVDASTHTSPHLALSVSCERMLKVSLSANYAESYRLPPIDALFWNNDVFVVGNPELGAERAKMRDVSVSVSGKRWLAGNIKVRRFVNDVDGMIIWRQRFDGRYMPVNLANARIDGTETTVSLSTKDDRFTVQYHRTNQDPINHSEQGGYLGMTIPFQPNLSERFDARIRFWRCRIEYALSHMGSRFIREANTKQLPGYWLHDIAVEMKLAIWKATETLRLALRNVTDERYEILERVPMPGRSITASLTIQL